MTLPQSRSHTAWTSIIAPNETIEVELIFSVPPREKIVVKESPVCRQLWDGFAEGLHSDCILTARDGKQLPCHRFILAARSTVFAAMFEHDMQEKRTGVCEIDDIDGNALEILLEFLYTNRVDAERIKDVAEEVYTAADKYGAEELCAACEKIMTDNLSTKTALSYLNFAVARGFKGHKLRAIKFLNDNAEEI